MLNFRSGIARASLIAALAAGLASSLGSAFGGTTTLRPRIGAVSPRDGWAGKNRVHGKRRNSSNAGPRHQGNAERARRVSQMQRRVCIDPIAIANYHAQATENSATGG